MADTFRLPRSAAAPTHPAHLLQEIRSHTGSDEEAASILRSIARFGSDPSIDHFELTCGATNKFRPGAPLTWQVRAVRY